MPFLCLLLCAGVVNAAASHDEAFDGRGRPRPAYQNLIRTSGVDVLRPTPEITAFMMGSPLDDSQKAWPVPLVLSADEYREIQRGVRQRGLVYKMFFHDLVMGERKVFEILSPVERATVEQAFLVAGASLPLLRSKFMGQPLSAVRFFYGPDLIRSADGRWLVLEDNIGEGPGGLADGDFLRHTFATWSGLAVDPYEFLPEAARSFLADVGGRAEEALALSLPVRRDLMHADLERQRVMAALRRADVPTRWLSDEGDDGERLAATAPWVLMMDDPATFPAKGFLRMIEDAAEGRRQFIVTLGIEGLSSKAILPLVDRLAEFYLGEPLLLPSPPTYPIGSDFDLGDLIDDYGAHLVIKSPHGRAGQEVYFLDQMDEDQREELTDRLAGARALNILRTGFETAALVAQPFVESSRLTFGGYRNRVNARIDIRPLAYVGPERTVVAEFPWGRASSPFGTLRHNVSQGAQHLVVLVDCEAGLGGAKP